jgi:Protein of unknown function (DUF4239)
MTSSVIMLPAVVVLAIAFALAIGIACTLQYLARWRLGEIEFARNEFAGVMLGMVSTLYALVLGFITVMVWQQYNGTADRVATETSAVADVWHSAVGFPKPQRTALRREMLAYARANAGQEWSLMRVGLSSPRGDALIMEATETAGTFVPANQAQSNAQLGVMRMLAELHDARQRRLGANKSPVSSFEWLVLVVGGIVILSVGAMFRFANTGVHYVMTSAVALMIATMFVLIFELQFPFRSAMRIPPTQWTALIQHIDSMDGGPQATMRM